MSSTGSTARATRPIIPIRGAGLPSNHLSPQPQGLRLYTRTARQRSRPQMALMRLCQQMFMGSLDKVPGSSLATELHILPPAPGSNLGNIVADKNQIVKNNDAN